MSTDIWGRWASREEEDHFILKKSFFPLLVPVQLRKRSGEKAKQQEELDAGLAHVEKVPSFFSDWPCRKQPCLTLISRVGLGSVSWDWANLLNLIFFSSAVQTYDCFWDFVIRCTNPAFWFWETTSVLSLTSLYAPYNFIFMEVFRIVFFCCCNMTDQRFCDNVINH